MPKRTRKSQDSDQALGELVVAAVAETIEEARELVTVLQSNDIAATTRRQKDETGAEQVAVLVPEEFADEAHVIIESQDAYDDFYDSAEEGRDEEELEADFEDDNF